MKKKILYSLIFITFIALFLIFNFYNNKKNINNQTPLAVSNDLSFMLETEYNSGEYVKSDMSTWPTNYAFNEEFSYCLSGSSLNWDDVNKKINISSSGFDKCYIYFKIKAPIIENISISNIGFDKFTVTVNAVEGTNIINNYYYSKDNGTTYQNSANNTYTFTGLTQDTTYNVKVYVKDTTNIQSEVISESVKTTIPTLSETILVNNGGVIAIAAKGSPDFATVAETNEGMYAMVDDYGTSYYFRGAVNNNWVKFNDMYWRIVRVNGDNSVKLIYSGTTAPTSATSTVMTGAGTQSGTSKFNSTRNSAEYVGYKYTLGEQRGSGTSSTIKTNLETWYANNLAGQDAKIADTIFCNDRSTYSGTLAGTERTGNGVGKTATWFGAARRLISTSSYAPIGTGPSLVCPHKEDAFTKGDITKGNGKLSQKVGLLTADEAVIAGAGAELSNSNYYLYTNSNYWLGSPSVFNSVGAYEFYVYSSGHLLYTYVDNSNGVRAVVSLASNISSTGSGEWNNPYVIN